MKRAESSGIVGWRLLAVTLLTLAAVALRAQSPPQTFTVGGGTSSGDDYEVTGSIGQMDSAPPMAGEDIEMTGRITTMMLTLPTPDGTVLTISVTPENTVVISWLSDGSDLVLQETSKLGATSWATVSVSPSDDGFTKSVTLPLGAGNKFFRLSKP